MSIRNLVAGPGAVGGNKRQGGVGVGGCLAARVLAQSIIKLNDHGLSVYDC